MFLFPEAIEVYLRGMQMNKCIYSNYVFSCQEFMVLSALTGLDKLNILMDEKEVKLNQKAINLILFQLYQKGIIRWKAEELYELNPEIRSLFLEIKESERELQIYGKNQKSPLLCYLGKEIVITELSETDSNAIKIHEISHQNFIKELQDRGFVPQENGEAGSAMEEDILQEGRAEFLCKCLLDLGEDINSRKNQFRKIMEEEEQVLTVFNVYARKKEWEQNAVFLLDCGLKDYIMFRKNEMVQYQDYSAKSLETILQI